MAPVYVHLASRGNRTSRQIRGERSSREKIGSRVSVSRNRSAIDTEVGHVKGLGRGRLSDADASAVVAFIIGALVFGAYAPRRTAGFAAPALRRLLAALS